ncbi:unnamed protein product [Clavelina lepadiformis]|uniref:Uncharacterized protein n=1 Tax=Clavelina lepadiformis TaxID=159417 RepID=A0ABP0GUW1_CLALP
MDYARNKICIASIIRKNLFNHKEVNQLAIVEELLQLTHIRLDRENIYLIENLDCLGAVSNLYLQQNNISKIQNLECLSSSLKFLTLAGNHISKVEGLIELQVLAFLDLSDNEIADFRGDEFPKSLIFVKFLNNKCTKNVNYRKKLITSLPKLKEVDNIPVSSSESSTSESSDTDSDNSSEEKDLTSTDVSMDLLLRASSRMDDLAKSHQERLKKITTLHLHKSSISDKPTLQLENFSKLQKNIKDLLSQMMQVEHCAVNEFRNLSTNDVLQSAGAVNTTINDEVYQDIDPTINPLSDQVKHKDSDKHVVKPQLSETKYVSEGTSISSNWVKVNDSTSSKKHLASKEKLGKNSKTSNNVIKLSSGKANNKRSGSKRYVMSSPDALVRIPGARPFHKL